MEERGRAIKSDRSEIKAESSTRISAYSVITEAVTRRMKQKRVECYEVDLLNRCICSVVKLGVKK